MHGYYNVSLVDVMPAANPITKREGARKQTTKEENQIKEGERTKLWLASAEELRPVTLVIPVWHTHLIQAPDSLRLIIWFDPD